MNGSLGKTMAKCGYLSLDDEVTLAITTTMEMIFSSPSGVATPITTPIILLMVELMINHVLKSRGIGVNVLSNSPLDPHNLFHPMPITITYSFSLF